MADVDSIRTTGLGMKVPLASGGDRTLFEGLDAVFRPGSITAVVGPSGSGKSTLLRLLNRMADPTAGRVRLGDRDIGGMPVRELRRRLALVPQAPIALADTVSAELRVGRPSLGSDEASQLLELLGIEGLREESTRSLSGGELQRLCLARTLAIEPAFLLADETTSALDMVSKEQVEFAFRAIAKRGVGIVMVSHDLAQVERLADARVTMGELPAGVVESEPEETDE